MADAAGPACTVVHGRTVHHRRAEQDAIRWGWETDWHDYDWDAHADEIIALLKGPDGQARAREGEREDGRGTTILHFATMDHAPLEVVRAILEVYPQGAQISSLSEHGGWLPLHYAAFYQAPLEVALMLLNAYPQGAQKPTDREGRMPLHWVVSLQGPPELVRALLDAYPQGAQIYDAFGALPLHYAAQLEVVRMLLDVYPQGAQMPDGDIPEMNGEDPFAPEPNGAIPLHCAVSRQASLEVVRALLDAYPQGAQRTSRDGRTLPLHCAVSGQASPEVVRVLLDAYPQGAQAQGHEECLPLHLAVLWQASPEVVRALLDVYLQGAQVTCLDGLPLHLAAAHQAPLEVVRALLDAYPQGAQRRERWDFERHPVLPLDLAVPAGAAPEERRGNSPKVFVMLALAHAGHPPSRPWTPQTCATLRGIAANLNLNREDYGALVRALVNTHISRVHTLLLALPRLASGIPSELIPLLIKPVYASDFFC